MKSKKLSEIIIKNFKNNGFVLSEPDVLLDSDYIIERSGEKFRSSMLTLDGEDGNDTLYAAVSNWRGTEDGESTLQILDGGSGDDTFYSRDNVKILGGDGDDTVWGHFSYLDLGSGDDLAYISEDYQSTTSTVDYVDGGAGNDTIRIGNHLILGLGGYWN